jgi:glycosyltransferase involved in cell wall biosynthesis
MRIVALVKDLDHVCCRYRLAAFGQSWKQAGHSVELRRWPRSFLSRFWLHQQLGSTDVLIIQRKMPTARQRAMFRQHCRFLIYDFDDALFLRDSYSLRGPYSSRRAEGFRQIVRTADVVVAGNSFLGDEAGLWTDADKVHVIPTCLDVQRYSLAHHRSPAHAVCLAWIGTAITLGGLELIRPALERLGQESAGLRLKVICDHFPLFQSLPVVRCPWSGQTEAAELAAADIGISWLPDDLWSQGKCGLKVLQYMAAGLPVVANAVGMQRDLVRHGVTGLLVHTPDEFVRAVQVLAGDADLRRRLGKAGRQRVERDFAVGHGAGRWLVLFEKLFGAPARRSLGVSGWGKR